MIGCFSNATPTAPIFKLILAGGSGSLPRVGLERRNFLLLTIYSLLIRLKYIISVLKGK